MSRDYLYHEGIVLGDFVVNEFLNSRHVSVILDNDRGLIQSLSRRLKDEVNTFRAESMNVLKSAELVIEPIDELVKFERPPTSGKHELSVSTPSPADISRPVMEYLRKHTLGEPIRMSENCMSPLGFTGSIRAGDAEALRSDNVRVGLLSGIETDDLLDQVSSGSSDKQPSATPPTPSSINVAHASILSLDLFAVLDSSKAVIPKGVAKRRRKTTKEVGGGVFGKDGSYYAVGYGGFIHLCGGALEWPFKTVELEFTGFFGSGIREK